MVGGEALVGGVANSGAVFRRGTVVDRPAPRSAPALHTHLRALRRHGFDGAPLPVELTPDGRERLTYLPGEVALPPFPRWVLTDEALMSVGRLLRRLHDASAAAPPDPRADWPSDMADPEGGPILCHNDVCPENVVFRDGRATALIDFDLAAPGRPIWDLAMTARYWVPMLDPESAAPLYPSDALDAPRRLRVLADGYGLPSRERAELPEAVERATAVCRAFVETRVAQKDPTFVKLFSDRGGRARWDRVQTWLTTHRDDFTAALGQRQ
ncbi:phosphotransferase [Streptomyces sp. NPDC002643]